MAVPQIKTTVFHVESRREAIDALANGAEAAIHDHQTNSLIHYAASELITRDDRGLKTDINAFGLPHYVLQQVSEELRNLGISAFSSHQIMEALQSYAIGLGADFAREAQAKPLYARLIVTDKKPDDMPECELVQATMIDGERRLGEGVSQRVMQSTIFGTRTSMTKEMNLDEMFSSSQKKWLLIYYGSPASESYKGIGAADVSLINLSQGLGRNIETTQLEAIEKVIKSGEASSTLQTIIEDFVEIERVREVSIGQDIVPITEQAEIAKRIEKISTALQVIPQEDVVGEALKPVIHEVISKIARAHNLPVVQVIQQQPVNMSQGVIVSGQASNDDVYSLGADISISAETTSAIIQQMVSVSKALTEKPGLKSPAEVEMQKTIELALEQVKGKQPTEAVKLIQQSINVPATTILNQNIQAAVAQLISPQLSLPVVQEMARQFSVKNPAVAEVVATRTAIQQIEKQLRGELAGIEMQGAPQLLTSIKINNPTELKQVLQVLKADGIAGLIKMDAQSTLVQNIPASARAAVEQFVKQNPSVVEAVVTSQLIRQIEGQASIKRDVGSRAIIREEAALKDVSVNDLKPVVQVLKAEGIAGLIKADAQSTLVQNIPASARAAIEQFIKQNPSVVEAVATTQLVRQIESQVLPKLEKIGSDIATRIGQSSEKLTHEDVRQVLDIIKSEGYTAIQKQEFLRNFPEEKRAVVQAFVQDSIEQIQLPNSIVRNAMEQNAVSAPISVLPTVVPSASESIDRTIVPSQLASIEVKNLIVKSTQADAASTVESRVVETSVVSPEREVAYSVPSGPVAVEPKAVIQNVDKAVTINEEGGRPTPNTSEVETIVSKEVLPDPERTVSQIPPVNEAHRYDPPKVEVRGDVPILKGDLPIIVPEVDQPPIKLDEAFKPSNKNVEVKKPARPARDCCGGGICNCFNDNADPYKGGLLESTKNVSAKPVNTVSDFSFD